MYTTLNYGYIECTWQCNFANVTAARPIRELPNFGPFDGEAVHKEKFLLSDEDLYCLKSFPCRPSGSGFLSQTWGVGQNGRITDTNFDVQRQPHPSSDRRPRVHVESFSAATHIEMQTRKFQRPAKATGFCRVSHNVGRILCRV
jgi:hypothetical protein